MNQDYLNWWHRMTAVADAAAVHHTEYDWPKMRWADFTPEELAGDAGEGLLYVDPEAMDALQLLRNLCGALRINSSYRDEQHNTRVGGAKYSAHRTGTAFDVVPLEMSQSNFLLTVKEAGGWNGIGVYNSFVHIDRRPLVCRAHW